MVGRKTEKTRLRRSMEKLSDLMRKIKHYRFKEQAAAINQILRGHYAYFGLGGNHSSLWKIYRCAEKFWQNNLSKRCWKSYVTWDKFNLIKERYLLHVPALKISIFENASHGSTVKQVLNSVVR